jgi:hypothetical protein
VWRSVAKCGEVWRSVARNQKEKEEVGSKKTKNATFLTQNQDFDQKSKKPNQKNYFRRLKKGAD